MNLRMFALAGAALLSFLTSTRADEASEAKLREQLKSFAQQLRAAQNEKSAVVAAQAAAEAKVKSLEETGKQQAKRIEELDKDMKDAKAAAEKIQEEQTAKITRQEIELNKYKASLDKWQAAHITITDIAKKKEAERAKEAAKAAELARKAADYRAKNAELYKLASEILARYEKFGLGEALAAREPFTGNAKVKLQNLTQDYGDKLLDQTAKP